MMREEGAMGLVICCADVGSVSNKKFGWARLPADEPGATCYCDQDIKSFADRITGDLDAGARVALRFECPLFVPFPEDPADLTAASR
jgi:hypothetical protein